MFGPLSIQKPPTATAQKVSVSPGLWFHRRSISSGRLGHATVLQEPGTTDMGPLGWDPWDGSHSARMELILPMASHHFWPTILKWDHASRTCVLVTCVHPRIPSCWFTDSLWFTKELKQNYDAAPEWMPKKFRKRDRDSNHIRGAEVGPYLGIRKNT